MVADQSISSTLLNRYTLRDAATRLRKNDYTALIIGRARQL